MSFLARLRKKDLEYVAFELGEEVAAKSKVVDLISLIKKSENYDEDIIQGIIANINADREAEEEERIREHELAKEKAKLEQEERIREHELAKEKAKWEHELALKKIEIEANQKSAITQDSPPNQKSPNTQDSLPILQTTPRLDWQTQVRRFDLKHDDIGLYLVHFERVMKRVRMDTSLWMACLTSVLPSEIVDIIIREPEELAENYSHVKELLLKRFKLSAEKFRQFFYSHKIKHGGTWREYYYELETYFDGWLNGLKVKTFEDLRDLIISDRIKQNAPLAVQEYYVSEWSLLKSPTKLADKIDEYIELTGLFKNNKDTGDESNAKTNDRSATKYKAMEPITCYNCFDKGHFARECPKPKRPKFCTSCKTEGHGTRECPKLNSKPSVNLSSLSCFDKDATLKTVFINGVDADALVDTAADISMIKYTFAKQINVPVQSRNNVITIRGIGGGLTQSLGICTVNMAIDNLILKDVKFYVVKDDTYQGPFLIIGKDLIDFPNLVMVRNEGRSKMLHIDEFRRLRNIEIEEPPRKAAVLRALETVTVQPNVIQLAEVVGNYQSKNKEVMFFKNGCNQSDLPLLVQDGKTIVPIVNYSDNTLHIKKDQVILRGTWSTEEVDTIKYSDIDSNNSVAVSIAKLDYKEKVKIDDIKLGSDTSKEEKQRVCDLLNEFRMCIALKPNELGCVSNAVMKIEEKAGSSPVARSPYRASHYERQILRDIICEMKEQGIVRDSTSEYSSPVLLVKKKTGEYRMVIDYRQLNAQTVKDKFPLPHIDDLLDRLSGSNLFCILDACQGFNQIPMDDESARKAAFTTPDGHYEPTRLFFGLSNGPAVFQRCMSLALGDLLWNGVSCFVDDIFFGSPDFENMISKLRIILEKLCNAGITLKLSKCEFATKEVEYLGFVVSKGGIKPGPRKLAAVAEFPVPTKREEIQRFLGLTGFFRRFIAGYASIAAPLTRLLKNGQSFVWTPEHRNASEKLRKHLVSKPVLKLFDPRDETELHTDASSSGLAGMLLQRDQTNALRLVYCVSRRTNPDEENYHSSRLELLAVVWSISRLRSLLLGLRFTIVTDCSAITYLKTQKNIRPQTARWIEQLSEFNYDVKHRSGDQMTHVDALSRAPVENQDPQQFHETTERSPLDITVKCHDKLGEVDASKPLDVPEQPSVFYISTEEDKVALIQSQDEELQEIIKTLKSSLKSSNIKMKNIASKYELISGILYRLQNDNGVCRKLFVMPRSMRKYLVVRFHDFSGHFGVDKVKMLIMQQFWFPRMTEYIKQHVKQCVTCAFTKVPAGKVQGKLNPIPPGKRPFELVHMDFLGPFNASSNRNTELLVIIDNLTKFVRLRACSSCSTKCVLRYFEEFINDFGSPNRVVTDRGSCFTSAAFKEFCRKHDVKHTLNCSQRPAANGQVERINRILIPMISASVQTESGRDWDKVLPEVQRCINWSPSKSTGKPPFELLFGYKPRKLDNFPKELLPTSDDYASPELLREEARNNILKVQEIMKSAFDKRHSVAHKYSVGDVVVVKRLHEATPGTCTKTQVRYRGPLVVMKVLPSDVYQVTDFRTSGQGRVRRNYTTTAHASQMKLFHIVNEDETIDDNNEEEEDMLDESMPNELSNAPREKRIRKLPAYLKNYVL